MCTLIEKIKQNLANKAETFKEDLQTISSIPFYTKYQTKTRRIQSQKVFKKDGIKAARSYALWSDFEDAQLKASFQKKMTVKNLALKHQRTQSAIESRLRKLKLITF